MCLKQHILAIFLDVSGNIYKKSVAKILNKIAEEFVIVRDVAKVLVKIRAHISPFLPLLHLQFMC